MSRVAIVLVASLSGCLVPEPISRVDGGQDDAGTCGGCVDAAGSCAHGFTSARCGHSGAACTDCGAGSCVNGRCEPGDGGCFASPVPGAAWSTACPSTGCPSGTFCLTGRGESASEFGCVQISSSCTGGVASCACMGCVCGIACIDLDGGFACDNGTISSREQKRDIKYLGAEEQLRLSKETLAIPLATYRYLKDPPEAKPRLGFIIEDQPQTSAAVRANRQHVDEYGYTSMLLATIQAQARQIAELEARVRRLEAKAKR